MSDNVRVAIRCRPLSEKEISDGYESIVEFEADTKVIVRGVNDQAGSRGENQQSFSKVYEFSRVFDWNSSQEEVYDNSCRQIVDSVLQGYNGSIIAYGQTGTGKTYTMEGSNPNRPANYSTKDSTDGRERSSNSNPSSGSRSTSRRSSSIVAETTNLDVSSSQGIIPRAFKHIFQHISKHPETQFLVRVSYLEIYQENIHDLLRKDRSLKLELHERPDIGVYVKDLTTFFCKSITEIERVMKVGNQNRRVAATEMNEHSSRSHAMFMVTIEQQPKIVDQSAVSGDQSINDIEANKQRIIKVGKLNLIDLAGSESQKKTNSFGQRQKESVKINLSLSALGNVINSLIKANAHSSSSSGSGNNNNNNNSTTSNKNSVSSLHNNDNHHHIPYRDSKLTRLLQDSLGGNARTLIIGNIGPASYNHDETINTLNYASRASLIRNKPRLNEDPKDALLLEMQREIDELRRKLADLDGLHKWNRSEDSNSQTMKMTKRKSSVASSKQLNDNDTPPKTTRLGSSLSLVTQQADALSVEEELSDMKEKLASLEGKLLNVTTNNNNNNDNANDNGINQLNGQQELLQGYTERQELELEAKRLELEKQSNRERAIRDELERKDEIEFMTKQSFSSIQQELDAKKGLIRQILVKIKLMRDSIESSENAYRLELDELDQLQYELSKELKLKCLIMDNFIPNQHVEQLLPRINYIERSSCCVVKPQSQLLSQHEPCQLGARDPIIDYDQFWKAITATNSHGDDDNNYTRTDLRPKSEFERLEGTLFPANIRFKCDQFLELEPEKGPTQAKARLLPSQDQTTTHRSSTNKKRSSKMIDDLGRRVQQLLDESLDIQEADIVI